MSLRPLCARLQTAVLAPVHASAHSSLRRVRLVPSPAGAQLAHVAQAVSTSQCARHYSSSRGGDDEKRRSDGAPSAGSSSEDLLRGGASSSFAPLPTPPRPGASGGGGGTSGVNQRTNTSSHAQSQQHTPSLRVPFAPSGLDLPESTFLKCIEKEIMDEKYRLDKEAGPPTIPSGWEFYHPPGTSLIYGRCVWVPSEPVVQTAVKADVDAANARATETRAAPKRRPTEQHFVRIQLTARDASLDPECDIRGEHFPFSFFVKPISETRAEEASGADTHAGGHAVHTSDADGHQDAAWVRDLDGREGLAPSDGSAASPLYQNSVEVRCDVIDGELVVDNVVYHGAFTIYGHPARRAAVEAAASADSHAKTVVYDNSFGGYAGPNLDEAEEEILDGIQSWLAERRIDDLFAEFVGQYSIWVEQAEYELWLQQLHDYVAA